MLQNELWHLTHFQKSSDITGVILRSYQLAHLINSLHTDHYRIIFAFRLFTRVCFCEYYPIEIWTVVSWSFNDSAKGLQSIRECHITSRIMKFNASLPDERAVSVSNLPCAVSVSAEIQYFDLYETFCCYLQIGSIAWKMRVSSVADNVVKNNSPILNSKRN